MAQVTVTDNTATVVFDDAEMSVLSEALRQRTDALQALIAGYLFAEDRRQKTVKAQEQMLQAQQQAQQGSFGPLGAITLK